MKTINRWSLLFILMFGVTLIYSCDTTDTDETEPISITGQVINKSSGQPISNAIVRIVAPPPEIVKTTNDSGRYSFEKQVDSTFSMSIEARKEGFDIVTQEILAVPERDVTMPAFKLIPSDADTSGGGSGVPSENGTGGAASIELESLSHESITVRETGGVENARFRFQVKDSAGRPIDQEHAARVQFTISQGPGGGENISPQTATTGESGMVAANLNSGTKAGAVKVRATIDRGSFTVRSSPVTIAIHSGQPDEDHFGVAAEQINFPGYNKFGLVNNITAYVGDKYGNIVESGTVVYFTTDGGHIEGSAKTDGQGKATVELISNNPRPEHPDLGPGYATIEAQTVDENDEQITTSTTVLFSGVPQVKNINPTNFSIPNGGSQQFTYEVSDQNGNPLAPGTNISVNAEGQGIEVIGDVSVTLGDAFQSGYGTTDFTFTLSDAEGDTLATRAVQITIVTEGPNGKAQATISGSHDKEQIISEGLREE